jgi:MalK OB fold domain
VVSRLRLPGLQGAATVDFLFDEPLSNLDAELRVKMRSEIVSLHRRLKSTMVYVTHDQVEAMTMADTIVVLRDGAVEQVGAPIELYARPRNQFVAGFLGTPQMNMLKAKVQMITGDGMSLSVDGGRGVIHAAVDGMESVAEADCTVGIRPEHIVLSGKQGCACGSCHRYRDARRRDDRLRQSAIWRKRHGLDPRNSHPSPGSDRSIFGRPPIRSTYSMREGLLFRRCGRGAKIMWKDECGVTPEPCPLGPAPRSHRTCAHA